MDTTTISALSLACLMIVLGFIALLFTKIYVADGTGVPSEIDVPIIGKLKTNYPALIFVILGSALAAYAIKSNADSQLDTWVVTGQIQMPPGSDKQIFQMGTVEAVPVSIPPRIEDTGNYTLHVQLKHGEDFEKAISQISYTNDLGSACIIPADELKSFELNPRNSLLQSKTALSRSYRSIPADRSCNP